MPGSHIKSFTELPITPNDLLLPSNSLFDSIAKYATNVMAEIEPRGLNLQRAPVADKTSDDLGSVTTYVQTADLRVARPATAHWAAQVVQLKYLGPAPMTIPEFKAFIASRGSLQRQSPPLRVIAEATVGVRNRANFDLFPHKLDRMVLYDHRRGMFTLRFRADVGSGVIPLLKERMEELDRLVDIVEALRRGGKHVVADTITLRNITFTYDSVLPPNQLPTASQDAQPPYKLQLILTKEKDVDVDVVLERGNPHLRVIDYLRAAANSPTFSKLPAWFIFTLPLFRALERMQDAWDPVLAKGQGACYIFHKSLDLVTVRFVVSGAQARRVNLDIQPRDKEGNLMWHVHRPTTDANATNENDEFNKVLKQRVWSANGTGFKGLVNGATASWDSGIENLVALVSETVLTLVGTPAPPQTQQAQHAQQMQRAQSQKQSQAAQERFPQQAYQQQQGRVPQQQQQQHHMPQPNMVGQGQQQRAGVGKNNNAPVVINVD
jgi:mediator of RNA polymerase II transcription subunit 14